MSFVSVILWNVLAIALGLAVGWSINMAIIVTSPYVIPPPAGTNTETMEGLVEAMAFFELKHFVGPFVAHCSGTFIGSLVAASFGTSNQNRRLLVLLIGSAFFVGGTMMVSMLPSPLWFNCLDLGLAYYPMSLLAYSLTRSKSKSK